MKLVSWIVSERDIYSAESSDCRYCRAKIGAEHATDCVLRKRTVVVRATLEYVVVVPECWSARDVEFHRNESSWCANNIAAELKKLFEHAEHDGVPCGCHRTQFEYVREAEENDEAECGVYVGESS